jgi:hypothetical protein
MTIHHGDCVEVMAAMPPDSIDAIVCDPPYGLEFMGKEWDSFRVDDPGTNRHRGDNAGKHGSIDEVSFSGGAPKAKVAYGGGNRPTTSRCTGCGKRDQFRNAHPCADDATWKTILIDPYSAPPTSLAYQEWCRIWSLAALRVAKPGAYLLAFGGTRTVHRMTVALEDAGWIIRDMLVWAYASGFPKSKALLKPAWEPIVMARKPGPLRDLDIDGCRIGTTKDVPASPNRLETTGKARGAGWGFGVNEAGSTEGWNKDSGRWPANVVLTDPIFDGGWDGVVGGGETGPTSRPDAVGRGSGKPTDGVFQWGGTITSAYGDAGTYSRFFLIPKASRSDREPVMPGMRCTCEAVKLEAWTPRTSPRRATAEAPTEGGFGWSTTSSGSSTTDPSQPDIRYTTSTETRPTTTSGTFDSSTPPSTSASTRDARSEMASGGSPAASATSPSPSPSSTGTSAERDGLSTVDADPATSARSSRPGDCEDCGLPLPDVRGGGARRGARLNAHPT